MQIEAAASNFNALFISRTVTLGEKTFSRTVNNSAILSTLPTALVKTFYSLHGPLRKAWVYYDVVMVLVLVSSFCSLLRCPSLVGNVDDLVLLDDADVMLQLLHLFLQLLLANLLRDGIYEDGEGLELFVHLFPVLLQPLKMVKKP